MSEPTQETTTHDADTIAAAQADAPPSVPCPVCGRPVYHPEPGETVLCFTCGDHFHVDEDLSPRPLTADERRDLEAREDWPARQRVAAKAKAAVAASAAGPAAFIDHMVESLPAEVDGHLRAWDAVRDDADVLPRARTQEMRFDETLASLNGFLQFTTADEVDRLRAAMTAARDRVKGWIAARVARRAEREAAGPTRPGLLDTLPHVRRFVELSPSLFDPDEERGFPTFFLFRPDGKVIEAASAGLNKQQYADAVKALAAKVEPVAIVMVCEMWVGRATTARGMEAVNGKTLSLTDAARCERLGVERREVWAVQVETAVGTEFYRWPILPAVVGEGRRLGEREGPEPMAKGGRFTGLVHVRPERIN